MTAYLLTVGDEILIGQITDTNSAWMAQQLNLQGIRIAGKSSVGDVHPNIIEAMDYALSKADLVLGTGGLGATKDDITKKAIAAYFGVEMIFHDETWKRLQYFFKKLGNYKMLLMLRKKKAKYKKAIIVQKLHLTLLVSVALMMMIFIII